MRSMKDERYGINSAEREMTMNTDEMRDAETGKMNDRYESRSWRGGRDTSAGRRDLYGRDYDRTRRERYGSPPRREFSPPHKRIRREWDDMPHEMPHYGGGGMMHGRGHPPNWGPGPNMGPPQEGFGVPGQTMPDPDYPTQPPMMSFKMFLSQQDDTISDQDAVKKYNEYKEEFRIKQINEFFLQHKEEEWIDLESRCRFKSKYHPEECEKRQDEVKHALKRRCDVFFELMKKGYMDNVTCDTEQHEGIVKLLDAAVILMEGGAEDDLKVLEEPDYDMDSSRSRNNSETVEKMSPEKKKDKDEKTDEGDKEKPLEITISEEQKELAKKAQEFSKKQQEIQNGDSEEEGEDEEKKPRKKKRHRDKQEYNYESGSESESSSGSSSDSEPEPAPPDAEKDKDTKEDGEDDGSQSGKSRDGKEEKELKRRLLHRTSSIFLRNLAPSITKQEVEALRDCDLGATLNRELKQRVRPVNGITAHQKAVKQDIKLAAKIIQNFDDKWKIWDDPNSEKKDEEKEFTMTVKNPVLKNITDYLVDEGSFEEEELLGLEEGEEGEEAAEPEIQIERDETLLKVLDTMILYLRIVHSIDYYSANEYPNEDEMPHRCGIMHCRGANATPKTTKKDQVEKFVTANTQELAKDKWLCPISNKKFKGPEFVSFFNNYLVDPKRPFLPEHPGNKTSGPPTPQAQQFPNPGAGYGGPPQGMMGYNAHRGGGPGMMRGGYGAGEETPGGL
ncbi:SRRTB-like protein [Mya arenaria]|uniref:SRRTB-like protein n=1 Tax=Mya arenaria TaxID=6604 RepID=A0ABY7FAH8_MYAAR|nr:SRRTB-like protein [Mya arenaria]